MPSMMLSFLKGIDLYNRLISLNSTYIQNNTEKIIEDDYDNNIDSEESSHFCQNMEPQLTPNDNETIRNSEINSYEITENSHISREESEMLKKELFETQNNLKMYMDATNKLFEIVKRKNDLLLEQDKHINNLFRIFDQSLISFRKSILNTYIIPSLESSQCIQNQETDVPSLVPSLEIDVETENIET